MDAITYLPKGAIISYDWPVTNAELWAAVGQVLARRRKAKNIPDAKRNGRVLGLSGNTVLAIERGDPKNINKLLEYCAKLDVDFVNVLVEALADRDDPPITAADWEVLAVFRDLGPTVREDYLRVARHALQAHPPHGTR